MEEEEEGEADMPDFQEGVVSQRMDWKDKGVEVEVEEDNLCGVEEKEQLLQKILRQNGLVWMLQI